MELRIIITYHGTGGIDGYKYQVEKYIHEVGKFIEIGELVDFPIKEKIVSLNGIPYEIVREYDIDETVEDEELEKRIVELKKYKAPKFHELKWNF